MTEVRPIIDLDREATPDQMAVLMDGIEDSLDHIVADTILPDDGYAGMVVRNAGTVITVGTGRLYRGGKVYALDTAYTFDVLTKLPVATKRLLLIVAFGTEEDTDPGPVNVLIEAQSTPSAPVYKAQTLAQNRRRLVVVQPAYGDEAPNPVAPGTGLALPIAMAVLTPTGIASLVNITDGKVPLLSDIADRTAALEAFQAKVGPQVSSLSSDLAGLASTLKGGASQQIIGRMLVRLADLDALIGVPTNAADSSTDYLLDNTRTDLGHAYSSCKVQEGMRFPNDGAQNAQLALFNPFETAGVVKSGVLFPTYDRVLRRSTGAATGKVRADAYTYNPIVYTQKTMTSTRVRYGAPFTTCSNSAWWQRGTYDPIAGVFTLPDGSTYRAALDLDNEGNWMRNNNVEVNGSWLAQHTFYRLQQFWTDTTTTPYWDGVVQAPQTIPGYHIGESELIGQDQWIDAIGFILTKLDAQGDVTVLICEADERAQPKPAAVLGQVTVPRASLVAGENVAALPVPILATSGKRISYVLSTTGAHEFATTDGASFPAGTFFVLAPSGFVQGDLTKHLWLRIYGCRFRNSTTTIQLQNLQLAGGIAAIDILARSVVPGSTKLTYAVQIAGVMVPLVAATVAQLAAGGTLQPNLPLYVTFAGSVDIMPCLDLLHSQSVVSRPATSFSHVWPKVPRTPPVSTSQIRAIVRFESYDANTHTVSAKLLTGANYFVQTTPTSWSDVVYPDGSLERTFVWNLQAAVASYKIQTIGTTRTNLKTFHGAWIKDFVL